MCRVGCPIVVIGLSSVAATGLGTSVGARMQAAAGTINAAAQLGTALGVAGVLLVVRPQGVKRTVITSPSATT